MRPLTRLLLAVVLVLPVGALAGVSPAGAASGVPHVLRSGAVGPSTTQVVLVRAPSASTTYATLEAWTRWSDGSWRLIRGRVPARIGRTGFTTDKREGDGHTPVGVFGVGLAFGWWGNPGTRLPYRRADDASVWVDDPTSAYYERWMQLPSYGRWSSAERLRIEPYQHALHIRHNPRRTPYRGSAIFLHMPTGGATAGCVAVDKATVLWVTRWFTPTRHPVFVLGPDSWVATH